MNASGLQEVRYEHIRDCATTAGFSLHDEIDLPLFNKWKELRETMVSELIPLDLRTSYESEFELIGPAGDKLEAIVYDKTTNDRIEERFRILDPTKELNIGEDYGFDTVFEIRSPFHYEAIPNKKIYPTPEECVNDYFDKWKIIKGRIDQNFPEHSVYYRGDHLHFSFNDIGDTIKTQRFKDILEAVMTVNWQAARPLLCTKGMLMADPAEIGAFVNKIENRDAFEYGLYSFIAERGKRKENHYEIRCVFAPEDGNPVAELPNPMLFAHTLLAASINYATYLYLHNPGMAQVVMEDARRISGNDDNKHAYGFSGQGDKTFNSLMKDLRNNRTLKDSLGGDLVEALAQRADAYWRATLPPNFYTPPTDLTEINAHQAERRTTGIPPGTEGIS